jgi:type II secretory pathway pseudopilin PulG
MVAVVLGIMILTILIAAVGPSIGTIMKREREEELIFRGKQIARSIGLFQRRYGRYPNSVKEMYESKPRTIRKLWKDPMCNCDFHALVQGMPDAQPTLGGGLFPPGMPQVGSQTTPLAGGPRGTGPFTTPTPSTSFFPTPTPDGIFGQPGAQSVGPIVGVRSTVHKEALREWRGQKYYDQWRFIVGDADRDTIGPGLAIPTPRGMPPFATPRP